MTEPRIVLSVPVERCGAAHWKAFWSLMGIAQRGWEFVQVPRMRTDQARQVMSEWLVEHEDFTHLCMLDNDHQHPPDTVERLARWWVADPSRLVIAGLNYRRCRPNDPICWVYTKDGHKIWPEQNMGLIKLNLGVGGVVAASAILIHRSVFETIEPPWWNCEYFTTTMKEGTWPSEDTTFCRRCQLHGIDLWCDTSLTAPHMGEEWIDGSQHQERMEREPVGERVEVAELQVIKIKEKQQEG